jgi:hypothetical protein
MSVLTVVGICRRKKLMKSGETARITSGPFLGMHGTLTSSFGQRAVLAVAFETREVQVELAHDWLVQATPRRPSKSYVDDPTQKQRKKAHITAQRVGRALPNPENGSKK